MSWTKDLYGVDTYQMFSSVWYHLRNEFDFRNVHGIMNTSGLLQSKWSPKGFMLTLQETRSIHDSINIKKKRIYCLYLHFL